jgi:hypothetical protein
MLNSFKFMRAPSTHVHILQKHKRWRTDIPEYIQLSDRYTLTSTYRFAGAGLYRVAFSSPGSCEKLR